MNYFRIDSEVARALREYCTGRYTWCGLLLGSTIDNTILESVMVPAESRDHENVEIRREYVELIAEVIEREAENGLLEIVGPFILSAAPPHSEEVHRFRRGWRGLVTNGCILYVTKRRRQAIINCFEIRSGMQLPIKEVEDPGVVARDVLEKIVEGFWRKVGDVEGNELAPGGAARLPLRCIIDNDMYKALVDFTKTKKSTEMGGVLVGYRDGATTYLAGCIFPPQVMPSFWGLSCEFETRSLSDICEALEQTGKRGASPASENLRPVGWFHTHPSIGVFLSPTDVMTFRKWSQLDPEAVAMVIDPLAQKDERLVYNGKLQPIFVQNRKLPPSLALDENRTRQLVETLSGRTGETNTKWIVVCCSGIQSAKRQLAAATPERPAIPPTPLHPPVWLAVRCNGATPTDANTPRALLSVPGFEDLSEERRFLEAVAAALKKSHDQLSLLYGQELSFGVYGILGHSTPPRWLQELCSETFGNDIRQIDVHSLIMDFSCPGGASEINRTLCERLRGMLSREAWPECQVSDNPSVLQNEWLA